MNGGIRSIQANCLPSKGLFPQNRYLSPQYTEFFLSKELKERFSTEAQTYTFIQGDRFINGNLEASFISSYSFYSVSNGLLIIKKFIRKVYYVSFRNRIRND